MIWVPMVICRYTYMLNMIRHIFLLFYISYMNYMFMTWGSNSDIYVVSIPQF